MYMFLLCSGAHVGSMAMSLLQQHSPGAPCLHRLILELQVATMPTQHLRCSPYEAPVLKNSCRQKDRECELSPNNLARNHICHTQLTAPSLQEHLAFCSLNVAVLSSDSSLTSTLPSLPQISLLPIVMKLYLHLCLCFHHQSPVSSPL